MKKIARYAVIFMSILGFIYLPLKLVLTTANDHESSSNTSFLAYNQLFDKNAQSNLKITYTLKSAIRQPESNYIFDGKFNLFVTRLIVSNDSSISNIIKVRKGYSDTHNYEVYRPLPSANFDMYKKVGATKSVKTINFKIVGDSIRTVAGNDSIFCYYYKFKSFSIYYNDSTYDIVANSAASDTPASIAFIKHNKFLYLVLISAIDKNTKIPPGLLYSIIEK